MTGGGGPAEDPRRTVALACRVLARAGLFENVLGHVSVRAGADRMLVRCRGPRESGLLFTRPEDVHEVALDGSGELPPGYKVPNEHPIHGELLRARPEAQAVVHAHPPSTLVAALAGLDLRPVFGAYNIPAMRIAMDGVPVYPRAALIRRAELAHELVEAMAGKPLCVMLGHGVTTVGESVMQAVVRALDLDAVARVAVSVAAVGGTTYRVPDEDVAELPDLGGALNDSAVWNFHVARLEHEGLGLG